MTTREENVKALKDLESYSLIAGMMPALIVSPTVVGTPYITSVQMFVSALAMKKIGVL